MIVRGTFAVLVGLGLVAVGLWFAWLKPRRIWRSGRGRWVTGRVVGVEPAGVTRGPPYHAWPPRVMVRYDLDGRSREGTLWLDSSKPDDYPVGKSLRVFVFGRRGTRLRTGTEDNSEANALRLIPVVLGCVAIGVGILNLVHPR